MTDKVQAAIARIEGEADYPYSDLHFLREMSERGAGANLWDSIKTVMEAAEENT
jgi:hypothetical protein